MRVEHNHTLEFPGESFSFSIVAEGNAYCDSNWRATETEPSYTRLYYMVSGECEIETARGAQKLTAGNLYMLPTGMSFSYRCKDQMQQLYFHIHLTNTYGADVLRGIGKVLCAPLPDGHIQKLLDLFYQEAPISAGYLKALLQADIFALLRENEISIQNNHLSKPIQKAKAFIEENLSAALTVQTVSDYLSISSATLSYKFRTEMGISIGKYIDGLVMCRAENLLVGTDLSLAAISEQLGFYDQFYFSRRFKERYSHPPLKYRKLHQKL